MGGIGHSEQAAHGFPLGACGYDAYLVVPVFFKLAYLNHALVRQLQIAELLGYLCYLYHAAALEAYYPSKGYCHVRNLLYAVYVGGESRHYHAALCLVEAVLKGLAYTPFRGCMSFVLHVGAVAHECKYPAGAVIRKPRYIYGLPVDGRIVHLEVAGVYQRAYGGVYGQSAGPRYGVTGLYELHAEAAQTYGISGADAVKVSMVYLYLGQLLLYESYGQLCGVYRHIELLEGIRHRAYVILMAVGYKYAPYVRRILFNVSHIRYDYIYSGHLLIREGHSAVHYYYVAAIFYYGHVLAYLPDSAEGDYLQFLCSLCQIISFPFVFYSS